MDNGNRPDLSVIIVSWNVRDLLLRCLQSVYQEESAGLRLEVFVVDNASRDGTVEAVKERFPAVSLIANQHNLGFVKANNQALAQARGRHLLLLNPDTEVRPGALATLVATLDAHAEVGAVGPRLVFGDGSPQSSRRRFPTLATALVESTALQRLFGGSRLLRDFYVADRSDEEEQNVDWLVGACVMVRREAAEEVGYLDPRFFMYSEELDWCRRLRRAGWQVRYVPGAVVVHHEARSSEQVPFARHFYFHDSRCRYFRKYDGPLAATVLRLAVVANYLFLALEDLLKLLLGHKVGMRWRRLRVYGAVARAHFAALFRGGGAR